MSSYALTTGLGSEVHDVAITYMDVPDIIRLYLWIVYIDVEVRNLGTVDETFWVAAYANSSCKNFTMGPQTISLAPGSTDYLTFEWQLLPDVWIGDPPWIEIFPPPWPWWDKPLVENFTVWAEAEVVLGDVNASNNVYVYGNVTVIWWVLDVNCDGKIDISDVAYVAFSFGSYPGHPSWNPYVDFNSDEKINIEDVAASAIFFGARY